MRGIRPHIFFGHTTSLCETCLLPVAAKIAIEGERVYHLKRCPEHGPQKSLISSDSAYWRRCKDWLKPGDMPLRFQSPTHFGCPFDCGLCPDHEQHSCLALLEINETCNLTCPVCFADSGPYRQTALDLSEIEARLDTLIASEGEPDLLQISGGEPTLHPDLFEILRLAKRRPIRHLMLNTNGIRLAQEPDFVARLAEFAPGFEIYLQFDSLRREALMAIRGADLRSIRARALDNLERHNLATTLVAVLKRGGNEDEIGDIIRHGLRYRCVRGVTFQPIQDAGRNLGFDKNRDRILLSDIRRGIIEQSGIFGSEDILPLPCNPEQIAIGYALREGLRLTPVTRLIPEGEILNEILVAGPNTIAYEKYPALKERLFQAMSLATAGEVAGPRFHELLCCLPGIDLPGDLGYDKIFRVLAIQFLDRFNFCVGQVKRSCIHFLAPRGQIIPFDTYNLFYRDGREKDLRARLRQAGG